jgi:RNase H-fold protein (predicted Holliday junction resolvase)
VTGIARDVKHFIQSLIVSVGVPVITVNEYASSKEARSRMMNSDMGGNDDAIAAMIVLQSYLDSQA